MPALKICGICNLEDATKCVELGADYLGLIFADSPRQVQPADARIIKRKLAEKVKLVGVFRNQDERFINDTADALNLDFVQLHGSESPEFCLQIARPVIKAIEIAAQTIADSATDKLLLPDLSNYAVHAFLFDRPKSMSQSPDWLEQVVNQLGEAVQRWQPFFIAGGLTADKLELAFKLNPFGIDLASGVEAQAGVKDHKKLEEFFQAARGAKQC